MKTIIRLASALALLISAESVIASVVTAQQQAPESSPVQRIREFKAPVSPSKEPIPATSGETIQPTPAQPTETEPGNSRVAPEKTQSGRICASDAVENLLPPVGGNKQADSPLNYLAQQGFTKSPDGSWVCYVSDPKHEGRYFTLFKVQEVNGKLIATSFLENGSLIEGQDSRSLEFFMELVSNHTKTTGGNRQSIRKYLESFVSLVRQGKITPSRRGFLFDQPSRSFVIYHPLTGGQLKGTAITININSPDRFSANSTPEK